MLVCLDANVLMWMMKTTTPDMRRDEYEACLRAQNYCAELSLRRDRIMLPMPAVTEYLVKVPVDQHGAHLTRMRELFNVHTLDDRAASIAAELCSGPSAREARERLASQLKQCGNLARQLVKTDAMILAIAIAQRARVIISHDEHLVTLAGDRIQVQPLPPVEQASLPFSQ